MMTRKIFHVIMKLTVIVMVPVMPVLLIILFVWITTSDAYEWNYSDLRNDVYEYLADSGERFDLTSDTEYDNF